MSSSEEELFKYWDHSSACIVAFGLLVFLLLEVMDYRGETRPYRN